MSTSQRSFARKALRTFSNLWKSRSARHRRRAAREALLVETLESRMVLASDLSDWFASNAAVSSQAPLETPTVQMPVASTVMALDAAEGESSTTEQGEGEDAPDLVAFAKALATAGVKFYGAAWCPHCSAQKELFQDGAQYLPFIEVTNPDRTPNQIAIDNNITTYPTWEFPGGARLTNEQTLEALATAAGIAIPMGSDPSLAPIGNQTVLGGAPLWLGLDGYDPQGAGLTYSVTVGNSSLLQANIPTGNRSLVIDVAGFGKMTFELFDHLISLPTDRVASLAQSGFYNKTATNEIIFHRVVPNFVIQAGDPTGTGSGGSTLGDFDDEFHLDLQHASKGLLSMAKSGDDTNDSQFFITDGTPRHLDFNHSVFGKLIEGDAVREAIQNTKVTSDKPDVPVVINSISVIENDAENGLLMLKAAEGASGTTSVTVTATDAEGKTVSQTFQVTVSPDTSNGGPFLADIDPVVGVVDQPIQIQLQGIDVEGDDVFFDAVKPSGETVNYTVNVNSDTGLVTITPPAGFVGSFDVLVGVSPASDSNTTDEFDTQLVEVTVTAATSAAPTAVDLLPASDTGSSNSDNVTNAGTLQFQVQGVTSGALVKLMRGTTVLAEGTASGTTITLSTTGIATAGEGAHAITATQTVGGTVSDASAALNVTYDVTPPAAFTSTAPTEARVGLPLVYNAENPDEGTSGFRYQLVTPPAGATINSATGLVIWAPTAAQVGNQSFGISAIDAAGNVRTQTVNLTVEAESTTQVEFSLLVTDLDGEPLTTLSPGQDFLLTVLVADVRATSVGVFSAFLDVMWDSSLAEATGPIQFSSDYSGASAGNTTTPGLIDEAGGVSGLTPLGSGAHEVFTVPMKATGSGTLVFAANPADSESAETTIFDTNDPVPEDAIRYRTATVTIEATFNAVDDTFNVDEDSQNATLNPLANDASVGGAQNELTITAVGSTNNGGTVTIATDGKSLRYTPAANFFGTETFTYTVENQNGETGTATVTVQVQPVNDAPTATNDTVGVGVGSSNNVLDVLANDLITPDASETLRVTAVGTGSAGGTITIGNNGSNIRYTPAAGFNGTETFTYTVSDRASGGLTATATVTVNVGGLTATADNFTVTEDTSNHVFDVLANDLLDDETGGTLTVTAVGTANRGGTVEIVENGTRVRYTPAANVQGIETFTYTISDGEGGTSTATVTVTITNVNDPPTATNDAVTGFRNTSSVFDVLANDSSNPDPQENLVINSVTQGSQGGTITIVEAGKKINYTPANNFTGTETFTYTVRDPSGAISTSATVTVTVQEFSASSLSGFVYFDVNGDGIKGNGEQPIAGVTITLTGTPTGGSAVNRTVKTAADGSYTFDNVAPGNYTITQTQPAFTTAGRTTVGSQGGTSSGNAITISSLAQGTTGINNNFGEAGRAASTLSIRDLFASNAGDHALVAFDASGNTLWHTLAGSEWQPFSNTQFTLNGSTLQLAVTNAQSQQVAANINTSSNQLALLSQTSSGRLMRLRVGPSKLTFSPLPANQSPTAVADTYTATEDTVLNVAVAQGVLKNDTDPNGNTLTASVVAQPQHGTLTLNSNGSFAYTPAANFSGTDTFTYRANDGTGQSQPATVTITVTGVNDAPTAANDSFSGTVNTPLNVVPAGVLLNDTDPDSGTTLSATVVTQPQNGTLTLNSNGSFTYTPEEDFTGTDTFTYRASDGTLQSAPATVTITINGENTPPEAEDDEYETDEDTPLTVPAATGVLENDSDDDTGDTLTAQIVSQPANGSVTLSANGSFSYTPNANFHGTDTFTYRASDGEDQSELATVTITVESVDDAPVATDDAYSTVVDTELVVDAASGVLDNDTDVDDEELTVEVITDVEHGTLDLNDDGSFTYTPDEGFTGTDTFVYEVTGDDESDQATVTITVSAASGNVAPEAEDDTYAIDEDGTLVVTVDAGLLDNDTDADDDSLTAVLVDQPQNGEVTFNTDGSFTYTPDPNFNGTDTFTYRASDGTDQSELATVTITVNPIGDAPVAADDEYTTGEDTELVINAAAGVLNNDADGDDDAMTVALITDVQDGTLVLNADGSFSYTPDEGFTGTDTFVYEITAGGQTDQATVTITVESENAAPEAVADSYATDQDTELNVAVNDGVLFNDSDPDDDDLTVSVVTDVVNGTLVLNPDGSFTYTPDAEFFGTETFVYEVSDGSLDAQATVTIMVNEVGEGEALAPTDLALMDLLTSDDGNEDDALGLDGSWTSAVDEVLTDLAS